MASHVQVGRCLTAVLGSLVLVGCSQLLGIEDTSVEENPPPDLLTCADVRLVEPFAPAPIDTETAVDDRVPSCGQAGSQDQTFGFTAPVTDYYVFDTFGSRFDTVLALYDQCEGAELACNNNAGTSPQSELVRKLEEGQQALLVVEGAAGDTGKGSLQVARVTCPDADLEGRTLPAELTTVTFGDDLSGACGGAGSEDRAYHWVAPRDGVFAFTVTSSAFTPAISLVSGPRCADPSLSCNAGEQGIRHAEVARRLRTGQAVSLVVDGVDGAGAFAIDIAERNVACPQATLIVGAAGQKVGPRVLAPSCGAVTVSGPFGGLFDLGDKTYAFTVPAPPIAGCFESCDVSIFATEPMILYALDGNDCSGPEIACQPSTLVVDKHRATFKLEGKDHKATPYTLVVADATGYGDGSYDIGTSCSYACP